MTLRLASIAFAASLLLAACGDDQSKQGFREPCSEAAGGIDGCDYAVIETPEDLCWRLVECGVIPVEEPEGSDRYDWAQCANEVSRLADFRFEHAAACVAASTCDELTLGGSPNDPNGRPQCLRHGDQ